MNRFGFWFSIVILLSCFTSTAQAKDIAGLGTVHFATSCSKKAEGHFLTGLAALHSFWYEKAREEFQMAAGADPKSCTIALWGEAMTHNYPIWARPQDMKSAQKVLAKIPDKLDSLKAEERGLLRTLNKLYDSNLEWNERVTQYSHEMARLHQQFPEHLEIGAFYSLSLQDIKEPKAHKHMRLITAGAIGLELLKKYPRHPGALHYTIHAFDDPVHAPLALPAANVYADVSPDSSHALHMPGHIYVQMGNWQKALKVNQRSWDVSQQQDWHTLTWLNYAYLQMGQLKKSSELLAFAKQASEKHHHLLAHYYEMAAFHVVEGQLWSEATKLLDGWQQIEDHGMEHSQARFASALSAYNLKDKAALRRLAGECDKTLKQKAFSGRSAHFELQIRNLATMCVALYDFSHKRESKALSRLAELAGINANEYLAYGVPFEVIPIEEFAADLLDRAGKTTEAWASLESSFTRFVGRSRGLTLAEHLLGRLEQEEKATDFREQLKANWSQADPEWNRGLSHR
ncbi:MAG: hypothetical protein H6624_04455 [Bdellovibrionaceae bacterium]|nr:hypothetical protein [Bdellovibrionales bacterium]MCB9083568.1 hypothetical protein [Pseudobdellovibrionaceae bacterium]